MLKILVDPQTCGPLVVSCSSIYSEKIIQHGPWIRIGSILRDKKVIIPNSQTVFKENDDVVFFAETNCIKTLEKLLSKV